MIVTTFTCKARRRTLPIKLEASFKILLKLGKRISQGMYADSVFKALGFRRKFPLDILWILYLPPDMNMRCPVDDDIVQIYDGLPDANKPYLFTSLLKSRHRKVSVPCAWLCLTYLQDHVQLPRYDRKTFFYWIILDMMMFVLSTF